MIFFGDLLGAQVLLYGEGEVGPALDRGIVGDEQDLVPAHAADARDDPGGGRRELISYGLRGGSLRIETPSGERRKLKEGRAWVKQALDPIADEQFAQLVLPAAVLLAAASTHAFLSLAELGSQGAMMGAVGFEMRIGG